MRNTKYLDLTGQRFGRLLVLQRVPNSKVGATRWLCKCDCGNSTTVLRGSLRDGTCKSCGCYKREIHRITKGESAFNATYSCYKHNAKVRGHTFALSKELFRKITQQDCYYCGAEPEQTSGVNFKNGDYLYNGIDRIDNNKGYEPENIVPCCGTCNYMKRMQSQDTFFAQISKIHNHRVRANL